MTKKTTRKVLSLFLCAAMIVGVLASSVMSFAATHDPIEDISTDTATLVLGKELTYSNRQACPISSVTYTVEKVEAWRNDNVNAMSGSNVVKGQEIAVADMPAPSSASVNIPLTDNTTTHVATGRANDTITFNKAGYYVYKIKEVPISAITGATVTSDTHEYFAVIYVCNKTADAEYVTNHPGTKVGDTIPGVYVHDITSYRNTSGSSTYKPTLTDIANVTDNGGTAAQANTQANLGKVGKSTTTGSGADPDTLEAYKMWNDITYTAPVDLTISKNVTGSLGDLTKQFKFDVTLSGLEANGVYNVTTTGTPTMVSGKGTYAAGKMTANASGELQFSILLTDDQTFNIADVPSGTAWSVTEGKSDHVASYTVTPGTSVTGGTGASATDANSADSTALTAAGTLAADTTAAYENARNITTITGVPMEVMAPIAALAAVLLIAGAFMLKRRNNEDEEYINACEKENK